MPKKGLRAFDPSGSATGWASRCLSQGQNVRDTMATPARPDEQAAAAVVLETCCLDDQG
jgi:hypothetical protein